MKRVFLATPNNSATPADARVTPPQPASRLKINKGHWIAIYTSSFHSAVFFDMM